MGKLLLPGVDVVSTHHDMFIGQIYVPGIKVTAGEDDLEKDKSERQDGVSSFSVGQ
jgi:hypothetical protein